MALTAPVMGSQMALQLSPSPQPLLYLSLEGEYYGSLLGFDPANRKFVFHFPALDGFDTGADVTCNVLP